MITYTCSDLIRQAKTVGNVSNVNMTNFDLSTTLLNTEYQKLYDKIVMANGANIKEERYSTPGKPFDIPEDCYHIIGVYVDNGNGRRLLHKSSARQYIKGNYRIENNRILFDGFEPLENIVIKYSTLPQTLTAPDTPEELNVDVKEVGLVTDKGFYFKDSNNTEMFYNFSSQEATPREFKNASNRFLDHTLDLKDEIGRAHV